MKISANGAYQDGKIPDGFVPYEFKTLETFRKIVTKSDHCCAVLKDNYRAKENFISSDFLWLDVDGGMSLDDFRALPDFQDSHHIIVTSRNHKKDKKGTTCDRFHVFFPVDTIHDQAELEWKLKAMLEAYPWADKAATDATRLLYAYKESEIYWIDGAEYCPPMPRQKAPQTDATGPKVKKPTQAQYKRVMGLLRKLAESGKLEDYQKWIDLGMAMKAAGYDCEDWVTILGIGKSEDSDTLKNADRKWTGLDPKKITGGSLVHFCQMVEPTFGVKGSVKPSAGLAVTSSGMRPDYGKPTTLETVVSPERESYMWDKITYTYTSKDGDEVRKLHDGWHLIVLEHDAELRNCAKHDYTIGSPRIAYANTEILKTAIGRRLRAYGVPVRNITDTIVKQIYAEVIHANRHHNGVLSFVGQITLENPCDDAKALDDFISYLKYKSVGEGDDETNEHRAKMYREIWHLFFLRMHMHIHGTEKIRDDEYYGLLPNDIVPILEGTQNGGKTTLCRLLACNSDDMYTDVGSGGKGNFGSSDTVRSVRGKLIAELGEMKMMKNDADVEPVKSFISKVKYDLDVKYVEYSGALPATVSYIGTSNPDEYFSDTSGNRRFFPMKVEEVDLDALSAKMKVIYRLHAYYAKLARETPKEERFKALKMSQELCIHLGKSRDKAMIKYSDHGAIMDAVHKRYLAACQEATRADSVHKMRLHDVESAVKEDGFMMRVGKNSVTTAMKELGYTQGVAYIAGASVRAWIKKVMKTDEKPSTEVL
jgi:hypothetical protein